MRFELKRTTATFAVPRIRHEINKGNAIDIPFKITCDISLLAMLMPPIPVEGEEPNPDSLINELFTPEGYVRRPSINPVKIHRKPEGATIHIYDEASKNTKKHALVLKPCSLSKLEAELKAPHQVVLSGAIQYPKYNDNELIRINALTNKNFDLTIVIEQLDMFEQQELGDDKKDGEDGEGDQPEEGGDRDPADNVADINEERDRRSAKAKARDEEQDPEE